VNTRASYPLHYIRNYVEGGRGGHPRNVVFLTADAFGVLPPIAKLTPQQAMYYFLSGYTAKVAGTERGVKEPQPTFSACFGAAFLVWHPTKYAKMLGDLLRQHKSNVWLINTGWIGGPYGVGERIKLKYTRTIVHAALHGDLDDVKTHTDAVFGLGVRHGPPRGLHEIPTSAQLTPGNDRTKAIARCASVVSDGNDSPTAVGKPLVRRDCISDALATTLIPNSAVA